MQQLFLASLVSASLVELRPWAVIVAQLVERPPSEFRHGGSSAAIAKFDFVYCQLYCKRTKNNEKEAGTRISFWPHLLDQQIGTKFL